MKYCRNCGSEVGEEDIYCGYCGSKLKVDDSKDGSPRQDFTNESTSGEDFAFSSDSDRDFEQSFDDDLDKDFDTKEFAKNDAPEDEFESYVESGEPVESSFESYGDAGAPKRKVLLPNKLAKEANTFGILALIFGFAFLGGALGIVFGIIGLNKAKRALALCDTGEYDGKPKAKDGRTLSIVGIILGIISIIIYIL